MTTQPTVDPDRSRAQPHGGHHVFHGWWDDRTRRHFSRVWGCVGLGIGTFAGWKAK